MWYVFKLKKYNIIDIVWKSIVFYVKNDIMGVELGNIKTNKNKKILWSRIGMKSGVVAIF